MIRFPFDGAAFKRATFKLADPGDDDFRGTVARRRKAQRFVSNRHGEP